MKRIKMAFMALAAVSSIGGAFAFSPSAKHNATTYYAMKVGNSFQWTTRDPKLDGLTCASAPAGICTISTANQPVDGQIPAGHTATNRLYQ